MDALPCASALSSVAGLGSVSVRMLAFDPTHANSHARMTVGMSLVSRVASAANAARVEPLRNSEAICAGSPDFGGPTNPHARYHRPVPLISVSSRSKTRSQKRTSAETNAYRAVTD